jgi:hypothetical protein
MAGSGRVKLVAAAIAVLAAAGCKDSGLPDRNLPLEEARHRQWSYPLYDMVVAPGLPLLVNVDETMWALQAAPAFYSLGAPSVPEHMLRAATAGGPVALRALSWDDAPFDRLYAGAGAVTATYERVY